MVVHLMVVHAGTPIAVMCDEESQIEQVLHCMSYAGVHELG